MLLCCMDRQRLPYAKFKHDPDKLLRVVLFPGDPAEVCKELGCTLAQLRRWQTGAEAVPRCQATRGFDPLATSGIDPQG